MGTEAATPKDVEGLGIGSPRDHVIGRLGIPKLSENDPQVRKQDMFEFQSGMHQFSKLRVIPYLGGRYLYVRSS
jgi:hypothetical protein